MSKRQQRSVTQLTPVQCSPDEPCRVCGGVSHPCYTRGEELWCAFIENEQEAIRYAPEGYEFFGCTPSGQSVFVPVKIADQRKQGFEVSGESPAEASTLREAIEALVYASPTKSELELQIPEIAKRFHYHSNDIWRLYQTKEQETEAIETRSERAAEIENLLKIGNYDLKLTDYLGSELATPLEKVAQHLGSSSSAMLTTLLPVAASLLRVGTRLELIRATEFYALPILYTGVIAESGSAKSPTQKTILKPLFKLQSEEDQAHGYQMQDWEADVASARNTNEKPPDKPHIREYFITDATREAIVMIQSQQPDRGFLGWFDELSALIGGQNQYRNGKGTDKEAILSGRDGTGSKTIRASGKRSHNPHNSYSITGSTQPDTLRKLIGDFSDPSGHWSRFLWSVLPIKPARFPVNATHYDVSGLLYSVYLRLEDFEPKTYRMSTGATKVYADWYNELDDRRLIEPRQGLRAVYSKMKADTGTLALLLHCINAAVDNRLPEDEISIAIMKAAIRLSKFYLGQVKLIHAEGGADTSEAEWIYTKMIRLSERRGWLKAKDAQNFDRVFKKMTPDQVRSHFRELEIMGLGTTRGTGRQLEWRASTYASTEFPDLEPSTVPNVPPFSASRQTNQTAVDIPVDAQSTVNTGVLEKRRQVDNLTTSELSTNGHGSPNGKMSTASSLSTDSVSNSANSTETRDTASTYLSTETSTERHDSRLPGLPNPQNANDKIVDLDKLIDVEFD